MSHKVEQVGSQKLLGIRIDKELNYNEHIDNLCMEVSQITGVLNKIKCNLPIREWKLNYNAMIRPLMLYGSRVWSSTLYNNIDRVYKLQKQAAHVILDADRGKRIASLINQLDWLPFKQEIIMQKCCLIFRQITGYSPSYMTDLPLIGSICIRPFFVFFTITGTIFNGFGWNSVLLLRIEWKV